MNRALAAIATIGFVCLAACGADTPHGGADRPQQGPDHLDPSQFVTGIDNPYLPLKPGTVWEYAVTSSDGEERVVVTVLERTRVVDGVTATVVHDKVTHPDGSLIEDTYDWFAQDKDGTIWYLGEATKAYEGSKVSTKGSWEAGVDGARAGRFMLAHPKVGARYQQEYYEGEAEDVGEVLATDESVTGPTGSYDQVVQTADTTPLEPGLVEQKWYAPGVGTVQERDVKGGDEKVTLVKLTRR